MNHNYQIILCTCPDLKTANELAYELVGSKLAGSANIIQNVISIFRWHNEIETANEYLLLLKTEQRLYQQIENTIKKLHPYEIPEIMSIDFQESLPAYFAWLKDSLISTASVSNLTNSTE